MSAQYWIAQYVEDVFRNEPRNVGVFVAIGNEVAARFVGESDDGFVDGRRLKNFPYPDVVRQWITYWRSELLKGNVAALQERSAPNFRVTEGGAVMDIGGDSAKTVAAYLYSTLVSDGGLREALAVTDVEEPQRVLLDAEVAGALAQALLLGSADDQPAAVPHPVRREEPVAGHILAEYKPAFVQRNGLLYVMETVDFTKPQKKASRDHAGWSACMYRDVRTANRHGVEPISIVRVTDADQEVEDVRNGLALLRNESQIVNWMNELERIDFLEKRRRVAFELA